MTSDAPSFVNVHTPKTSFVIPHSFNLETIDDLFHKVTHKLKLTPLDTPVGLGWVKYEWNDSIWDLDDSSDYTILAWRLKSLVTDGSPGSSSTATLPHNSFPLTLHIRNPEDPLPKPPAYVNPSYYVYRRPASLSPSLSDSHSRNHDGMRTQSRAAGRSMKSSKSKQSHGSTSERGGASVPQFKKDFMNFHSENGVRTVIGKIGPVRNVRMLLKSGYRHVYISRAFALKHGFIPADAAPGMYGYSGLVNIGKWPITVGKTTTTHPVYLSEESHFECVLGRSFMERRGIKTDPTDPTNVVCLDTGEKIDSLSSIRYGFLRVANSRLFPTADVIRYKAFAAHPPLHVTLPVLHPRPAPMPPLVRILPQFAVGRRAYSFFSSKSGGGRYFNPAKASKAIAPTTTTPARSTQSVDASISPTSSELAEGSERVSQPTPATLSTVDAVEHEALSPSSLAEQLQASRLTHPILKPHEFKLHHFFALHRPYLLLNQPTSALFETAQATQPSPPFVATIDNPPEASAEADADAARQLSRALVVNRVGNTVDWDVTLQRLGISASDVVGPTEEANILLDSTKRKRRRKMKKHKLKKRRRLTRSTRLRLGK